MTQLGGARWVRDEQEARRPNLFVVGGVADVYIPFEGVAQHEQHQGHRQGVEEVPVVGVLVLRRRGDVVPGDVGRQPHVRRPEQPRHVPRDLHPGCYSRCRSRFKVDELSARARWPTHAYARVRQTLCYWSSSDDAAAAVSSAPPLNSLTKYSHAATGRSWYTYMYIAVLSVLLGASAHPRWNATHFENGEIRATSRGMSMTILWRRRYSHEYYF